MGRKYLSKSVLDATRERVSYTFDNFEKIYLSLSGGKDSTAMFHIVIEEAKKRNRKIGVFLLDWECQFEMTINHIEKLVETHKEYIDLYWVCLEIETMSACSAFEPLWRSWDEEKKTLWTREKPSNAITDPNYFPFYYKWITFEEFVPLFGKWYSEGKDTACFVGIRSQESLNRWRAISREDVARFDNKNYTTNVVDNVWNIYPIYDWKVEDIWTYFAKEEKPYNKVYDRMYQAGLSYNQMRIDEPFGDEARKNLWLYQIIEPITWSKFTARMAATVRHNRARGKHKVESMSEIVMHLKKRKWSDNKIAKHLGMDADEVLRLRQISGLTEAFLDREFSEAWEPEYDTED